MFTGYTICCQFQILTTIQINKTKQHFINTYK